MEQSRRCIGASSAKRPRTSAHLESLGPMQGPSQARCRRLPFQTFSVVCYIFNSCLRFIDKRQSLKSLKQRTHG